MWNQTISRPTILPPSSSPSLHGDGLSAIAVFHRYDGSRVEIAVRNVACAYLSDGPELDRERILISTPEAEVPIVEIIEAKELRELVGAPQVLAALDLYRAGDLRGAARRIAVAGARWECLIDLLGGPA